MSRDDLNETLLAIGRARGTATFSGGDMLSVLDELQKIEREVAQVIYDDGMVENDLRAVMDDIEKRIDK